jgi:hypothetical protein
MESPTKNWSKLLTPPINCRRHPCDAGSLMQNHVQ